jgi:hypothetical protein
MSSRPRLATTTLAGPSRLVLAAATGGLVALASAGTALLVLTGTSSVTPSQSIVPPLPARGPLAHAPGVVVVPSPAATGASPHRGRQVPRRLVTAAVPVGPVAPQALAFVADAPAQHPAIGPRLPLGEVASPTYVEAWLRGRALAAARRAPIAETVARGVWPAPVGPPTSTISAAALAVRPSARRAHGHRPWHHAHSAVRHGHHRHGVRHRHA